MKISLSLCSRLTLLSESSITSCPSGVAVGPPASSLSYDPPEKFVGAAAVVVDIPGKTVHFILTQVIASLPNNKAN